MGYSIGDDERHNHVGNDGHSITGLLSLDGTHRGSEFHIPWFFVSSVE